MARVKYLISWTYMCWGLFTLGIKSSPLCTHAPDFYPEGYGVQGTRYGSITTYSVLCPWQFRWSTKQISDWKENPAPWKWQFALSVSVLGCILHSTATSSVLLDAREMVSTGSICCQPIAARPALSTQASWSIQSTIVAMLLDDRHQDHRCRLFFFFFCYLLYVTQKRTRILKHHDAGN